MVCLVWVLLLMDWEVLNLRQPSFDLRSSDHCFIIPSPLKRYSCFHGLYCLWASHSYSLLFIFHHCSCSSRIPSVLPFYFKCVFPQPITLCTAASFSFDLCAPSQCRGTCGLHDGGEALRAHIPMRRWMEITVKYSTNIWLLSGEEGIYICFHSRTVWVVWSSSLIWMTCS